MLSKGERCPIQPHEPAQALGITALLSGLPLLQVKLMSTQDGAFFEGDLPVIVRPPQSVSSLLNQL